MEFLLNRFRNLTVLLLVILAQLVLLAYQVKSNQDVRLIRVWSVTAVTPIARVLEFIRRNTIGVVEDYFVLVNVRNDNRKLNEALGRMKMENQYLRTELQTADRALVLRAFQKRTPSRTVPARIIGTGTGTNSRVVFVDQGAGKGIMRGMAVVTPDGIVGKVLAAYPTASQVLLITDPTFAAGVISEKNRVQGTLKGQGQSKVIIDYVQNDEKVDAGETFYTSGDDRVFPKGFPVGKVTLARPGKTFKEIYLAPAGLQHGLEEVLIVIEGVHQELPDPKTATPGYYMSPAPKTSSAPQAAPAIPTASGTDADKIRDRYRRIGEATGYKYGEGFRSPDFNLDPNVKRPTPPMAGGSAAPKPQQTAPAPPVAGGSAASTPQQTTPAPPVTGGSAAPKPQQTTPAPPVTGGSAAPKPQQTAPAQPEAGGSSAAPKPQQTPEAGGSSAAPKPQQTAPKPQSQSVQSQESQSQQGQSQPNRAQPSKPEPSKPEQSKPEQSKPQETKPQPTPTEPPGQ